MGLQVVKQIENDLLKGLDAHRNLSAWFNGVGLRAEGRAKQYAPVLTGALRASINWALTITGTRGGGPIQGRLRSPLRYARRQEWEHRSRSFYMYRAVVLASKEIESVLSKDTSVKIWIGAGGRGGAKYGGNGLSGNPALGGRQGAFTYSEDAFLAAGGVQGSARVF